MLRYPNSYLQEEAAEIVLESFRPSVRRKVLDLCGLLA